MLQQLRDSNPAKTWLYERFQTSLRLATGQHIVVRFDLGSCGPKGFRFDADEIVKRYDPGILVDKEADFGEYLNVAATIAATLNEKIQLEVDTVLAHIRTSFDVLDALSCKDRASANLLMTDLALSLLPYNPRAKEIWMDWLDKASHYADTISGSEPGFGVDTLM